MYIVLDIGGTKTRIAASVDLETLSEPVIFDTPRAYDEAMARIIAAIREISAGKTIDAIVVGKRGALAPDGKTVLRDGAFPEWVGKPLVEDIEKGTGAGNVLLVNDTTLVGLGEAVFGAGKGRRICAYITISTGTNGARIVDGRIDRARDGFEIGGQYVSMAPLQSIEEMISGEAIEKRFGMPPKELGQDHPVWEELARIAAIGVHNTILHWSPDIVVLGGSMLNDVGISVDRVRVHLADVMRKFPALPEVRHSSLGDIGGLWGGLAFLRTTSES